MRPKKEVNKMEKTPLERMKYAMDCKPMMSKEASEAYMKIASMCKAFDDMPMPLQDYVFQAEEEFGEAPESVV
jgi:hypothetical protein